MSVQATAKKNMEKAHQRQKEIISFKSHFPVNALTIHIGSII